jgi:hypothetical protein
MPVGINQTSDDPPEPASTDEQARQEPASAPATTGPKSAPRLPKNRGVG